MKIIDCEKKGNVVRFYLGNDNLKEWYGDDWDDTPYEHNCGGAYDDFVKAAVDIAFPYDYIVCEPKDDWHYDNSPYCRNDFVKRRVPCIAYLKVDTGKYWDDSFSAIIPDEKCRKIYFGDSYESLTELCDGEICMIGYKEF